MQKNILIVCHYYPPHIGGIETVAYEQAKRLVAVGNKVEIVTSSIDSKEKSCFKCGISVKRVKAFNFLEKWGIPYPIFFPNLITVLLTAVKRSDLVHVHDAFYLSSFFAVLCARWYRKPIVLTQHVGMVPHANALVRIMQKIIYKTIGTSVVRSSDKIITLNDRVEDFLLVMGAFPNKLVRLSNGIDTDFYYPASAKEKNEIRKKFDLNLKKKIILFVGRFVFKKGFHLVISAQSNDYQIVMVGGRAKGKGENIIFFEQLSPDILKYIYRASDIFILPSAGEGFPLTAQEAMSSGLPVILGDDIGYKRYGFDKEKIILLNSLTGQTIRSSIQRIMNDNVLLNKMSRYSRSYSVDHFRWQKIITRLEKIYDNLLSV